MTRPEHKARIARRFDAAAATYDVASEAQRSAAGELARQIRKLPSASATLSRRVLEIGCGSGHLTRELLPHGAGDWFISDIAPAMVARCRTVASAISTASARHYLVMDGEQPAIAGPFDLIVSNLAMQWFTDLPGTLARLASLLAPGGVLAFSTLGERNFAAWHAAHSALGLAAATPAYPSAANITGALPSGLVLRHLGEQNLPAHGASPLDFVRGLRAIGADTPSPGSAPLTPGQLRRVLHHVTRPTPAGIPDSICYHLVYVVAQRAG